MLFALEIQFGRLLREDLLVSVRVATASVKAFFWVEPKEWKGYNLLKEPDQHSELRKTLSFFSAFGSHTTMDFG